MILGFCSGLKHENLMVRTKGLAFFPNLKKGGIFKIKAPSNFRGKIEEKWEKWIFAQTLSRKSYL